MSENRNAPAVDSNIWQLIDDLCSGAIQPDGVRELESYLSGNEEAQDFFVEYCQIHVELSFNQIASNALDSFFEHQSNRISIADVCLSRDDHLSSSTPSPIPSSILGFLSTATTKTRDFFTQPLGLSLLLAAITVISGVISLALIYPQFKQRQLTEHSPNNISPKNESSIKKKVQVARLTGQIDCIWADNGSPKSIGQTIYKGESLKLNRGLAEITYHCGARVVLQGPVVFNIDSAKESHLLEGKLSAIVPSTAKNFTIQTKAAKIVDIGTEFSVKVNASQQSLVHVHQGIVDIYSNNSETAEPKRLTSGQSLKISLDGNYDTNIVIKQQFVRPKQFTAKVELPVTDNLHLWLKADVGVKHDSHNRVTAWIDQSPHHFQFIAAQEVRNSQPTFVPHSWSTRPTVYFDGKSSMLTSVKPISLFKTNRSGLTAFLVFKTKNNAGQKMILDQSFSTLKRNEQNFELGYDVGRKEGAGNFGVHRGSQTATIAAENTIENNQRTLITALILGKGSSPDNVRLYKNGYRLSVESQGRDFNDQNQGWLSAGQYVTDAMPIDIGGRDPHGQRKTFNSFHHGDIAEIIIYRSSLTMKQRDAIEQYLKNKWF